jgi:hypothetical protein
MGILDDAIRQHLELKRQHGAPEEELQRQEEEALGPARRNVAPAEAPGADGELELEAEEPAEEAPAGESGGDDEVALEGAETAEDASADAAPEAHEQETMLHEPEPGELPEPDLAAEGEPAAPEAARLPEIVLDDRRFQDIGDVPASASEQESPPNQPETADPYDAGADMPDFDEDEDEGAEHEPRADEAPDQPEEHPEGDADVLEDTPDFLQETPEHDRLWFEQKPPRDFDFD